MTEFLVGVGAILGVPIVVAWVARLLFEDKSVLVLLDPGEEDDDC